MSSFRDTVAQAITNGYLHTGHFDENEVTEDDLYVADAAIAVMVKHIRDNFGNSSYGGLLLIDELEREEKP